MRRTVNHTGRKKINLDLVQLEVDSTNFKNQLEISWDLTSLDLEPSFEIILEVDSFAASKRIELGLLGPGTGSVKVGLGFIPDSRMAKVQLLVVDASSTTRVIKAKTTNIPVTFDLLESSEGQLLKVQRVDDLDSLWRVEYATGEPVLQICNRDGLYPKLVDGPLFLATVLPSAVKEIALVIFLGHQALQEETRDAWLTFLEH